MFFQNRSHTMLKFCLTCLSPLSLLLLLLPYSLLAFPQQVPFSSPLNLNNNKYFTLKQVLHHGGISNSGKNLFRKLEIKQNQNPVFKEFSYPGDGPFGEYVVNSREDTRVRTNNFGGKKIPVPNYQDVSSVLSMAKMSYNAYIKLEKPDQWMDFEDFDYEKLPFGWEDIGLRGYVFSDSDNSTVVIAFKGTSLKYVYDDADTAPNDKYYDNLMFSCCCAKVDLTWRGICDCKMGGRNEKRCDGRCVIRESNRTDSYFETSLRIYNQVKKDYPNSEIWLTGHSLGGSIASLVALKHDLPAIVFMTPGERLYAERVGLDIKRSNNASIYHFGHSADPIFTGDCVGASTCYAFGFAMETKCHIGKSCVYDTKYRLDWRSNIKHHALLPFVGIIKEWSSITRGEEDIASCRNEIGCKECGHWEFEYEDY